MSAHLFACLLCLPAQTTVDELIAGHQATMAKIQSLAVECDTFQIQPGKPPEHTYHQICARDATRKRTGFEFPASRFPDGTKRGLVCGDLFEDTRCVRSLVNWDRRTGKRAADSDGVRAEILPAGPKSHTWIYEPMVLLLQRVQPADSNSWEVGNYFRRGSAVKVLPAVKENGRTLIPVSLNHPSFGKTGTGVGVKTTIYFAPDHGGLILKQVHDVPKGLGFTAPFRLETSVVHLKPVADGLQLPLTLRHVMTGTGPGPPIHYETMQQISTVQINGEVLESAFDFQFPEGIVVKDCTQSGGILMHRWGAADAPAETWGEEPPAWAYAFFVLHYGADSRVLTLLALLTSFLCLTAWFLIRRQRRKQQAAVTS